jgi:uncharacterized protein YpiB (UPF0302 family)
LNFDQIMIFIFFKETKMTHERLLNLLKNAKLTKHFTGKKKKKNLLQSGVC